MGDRGLSAQPVPRWPRRRESAWLSPHSLPSASHVKRLLMRHQLGFTWLHSAPRDLSEPPSPAPGGQGQCESKCAVWAVGETGRVRAPGFPVPAPRPGAEHLDCHSPGVHVSCIGNVSLPCAPRLLASDRRLSLLCLPLLRIAFQLRVPLLAAYTFFVYSCAKNNPK